MVRLFTYGKPLPKYVLRRGDGPGSETRLVTISIYCEPGSAVFLTATVPTLPAQRLEGVMYQLALQPPVDPIACLQAIEMLSFLPRLHEESWTAAWAIAVGYLVPKSSQLWQLHHEMKRWLKMHGHYEPILAGARLQSQVDSLVGAFIEYGIEVDAFSVQQAVMNRCVELSRMLRRCGIRTHKEYMRDICRRDSLLTGHAEYMPEFPRDSPAGRVVRNRQRWEYDTVLEYAAHAVEEGVEDPVQILGYGHYGLLFRKAYRHSPITCAGIGASPRWYKEMQSDRFAQIARALAVQRLATRRQPNSQGGYRYRMDNRLYAQAERRLVNVLAWLGD